MAITQVGTPTRAGFGLGTNVTGTEPSGTAQDDILVAAFFLDNDGGAPTPPASWNTLTGSPQLSVDSLFQGGVYWIKRGASAPSLTWTWDGDSVYREVIISAWRGVDGTSPINQSAVTTSGNRGTPDGPAVTPNVNDCAIITVCFHWTGAASGGWTAPTNYNIDHTTNTNEGLGLARRILSGGSGVSQDPGAWSAAAGTDDCWEVTLALAPSGAAGGAVIAPPGGIQFRRGTRPNKFRRPA
jgi:hypothetical protein